MPIAGEAVVIAYETQSEYDALTNKNPNAIYFITDTMRIYVGSSEYYSTMNDATKQYVDTAIGGITDTKVTQGATPLTGIFDLLMAKTAGSHSTETDTAYKSGSSLNYNVATSELSINGNKALTTADIVTCTQSEYDAMQTRTGVLYLITGEVS